MCEFVCVCFCVFVCVFCVPNSVFLIVCDVGTSTNSHSSPQFAAAQQKVTQNLLTDTRIPNCVLFQSLDSVVVSVLWTLLYGIFQNML